MVRKLVLAVAAASALMSSGAASALGVGDINLRSALNQPLDAEIELLEVRDLSSQEVISALATPDEFGRAGIERIFFLNDLTFTPMIRSDGKSVIRVTSTRPVREPFLNFLMEVRWPSGRVLREFTLLLDPPLYEPGPVIANAPISRPAGQPQVQQPVQPARPAPPRPQVQQAAPYSAAGAAPAEPLYQEPDPETAGEVRTNRSDTLWELALRHRPQGASVHQTMLAIQDLNPDAFIGDNINRLRAGQTLSLPDVSQATGRTQSEAVRQVAAQNDSWQQGRQTAEPSQRQLDARKLDEAAAAPQSANNGDALRLVGSGEEQDEGGADASSRSGDGQLRDQLDTTKEELDSVRREKEEAESRLADMQSQMETLQRLLELKDEQLAAMQQTLGDSAELPEESAMPADGAGVEDQPETGSEPLQDDGELATDDDEILLAEDELLGEADSTEALEAEAIAPDAAVEAEQPAPAVPEPEIETVEPADEPEPVVQEQPATDETTLGLLQRMMQNQTLLIAGGGLILLLLLLALMAVARRNARREEDMADNFIARAAQDNDSSREDADQFNVALAGYQEESASDLDVAEDPLVEADALIAYGKVGEAHDVLSAALDREPERTDLRLKLMEVKGLLDDADGYAEQEAVLRQNGTVDSQIDMLNVRFPAMAAALASSAVSSEEYPEWDEDFLQEPDAGLAPASAEQKFDEPESPEASSEDYDFSGFGIETEPAARQEPLAEESLDDFDLDFDLDESLAESLAQTETPESTASETQEDGIDFGLNSQESVSEVPPKAEVEEEEFTLDEDFDLSLTDDLDIEKSDDLKPQPKPDTELEPMEEEQTVTLSDTDLEAFEAELDASMAEREAQDEADEIQLAESDEGAATDKSDLADEGEDEDEFDFLSGTDESATKLDLARAYIDMGDNEGAKDILTEVIDEGNEQQQQEARDMMGQLD